MIRVSKIGDLRDRRMPMSGIALEADELSLRGFRLVGEKVDLLPAGELARAAQEHCQCEFLRATCGVCRLVDQVRAAGLVEGSP